MILYTKTDIFNFALGELGSSLKVINADTDSTHISNILRGNFDISLSEVLDMHDWNCLRKTAALASVALVSNSWGYKYAVPEDCHMVRRIAYNEFFPAETIYNDQKVSFVIENNLIGSFILTNIRSAWAEYTARPGAYSSMVSYLARAVAVQLALNSAPAIITNNWLRMKKDFLIDARNKISQQIATDIVQMPEPEASYSPFLRARLQ